MSPQSTYSFLRVQIPNRIEVDSCFTIRFPPIYSLCNCVCVCVCVCVSVFTCILAYTRTWGPHGFRKSVKKHTVHETKRKRGSKRRKRGIKRKVEHRDMYVFLGVCSILFSKREWYSFERKECYSFSLFPEEKFFPCRLASKMQILEPTTFSFLTVLIIQPS